MRQGITPDDLREALAFARAFHEGDGDGAALLWESAGDPTRLLCSMADLVGECIADIAEFTGRADGEVWAGFVECLEHPLSEYTRRRNRKD